MNKSIFEFNDYREFLKQFIDEKDGNSRGYKSYLADQIGCQRSFVSQVLHGNSHFNLENGEAVGRVLGLTNVETDFLLLLISYSRAGTVQLRERFLNQIKALREKRKVLKNRFKENDTLSFEDKVEYYSSWAYGAIRVLITIPQFQTRSEIESYLQLPKEQITKTLDFLISRKIIQEKNGKLYASVKHFYLGNENKLIIKHHTNWRIKAIESLDREKITDLHFSSVNSLSREDALRIRDLLINELEKIRATIKDSKEECLYTLCVDFFETT